MSAGRNEQLDVTVMNSYIVGEGVFVYDNVETSQ